MTPTLDLSALLAAKEVMILCGSGGVGKTSMAAATAVGAAARLGGKVLVVTIDPARRLATALGIGGLGNIERRVPPELLVHEGLPARGEVWAAMLDTKQSWDQLVLRHAPDEETAYRILENRMYHNLTARFAQSHDYIAMERLYDLHASGKYDLIVVDTPPTRNAIDFLEAPARMAEFFGGRLLRWLTLPYRAGGHRATRVLNVASRPFYQVADRVLGSRFLEDIAEFFVNFQAMYDGFVRRAQSVERLLRDSRTTFAVVTTLEAAPLHEAEEFCRELRSRDLDLGALILNRTLPDSLLESAARRSADALDEGRAEIAKQLVDVHQPPLAEGERVERVLETVASTFRDYAVVAAREAELRSDLATGTEIVTRVPILDGDVTDVARLAQIADHLFDGEVR